MGRRDQLGRCAAGRGPATAAGSGIALTRRHRSQGASAAMVRLTVKTLFALGLPCDRVGRTDRARPSGSLPGRLAWALAAAILGSAIALPAWAQNEPPKVPVIRPK